MASTGYRDTGARLSIGGSVVNIAIDLEFNVSRTDNTVTFSGLAQYYQYQRLSGGISSFTYGTGWESYFQVPAGGSTRTGQFSSGTRSVNTQYGPTGGSDFSVGVGANDTTYTMQAIGRYLNDGMSGSGSFNVAIPALGSPTLDSQSSSNVLTTTATVSWTSSPGANGTFSSLQLQYGLTTGYGTNVSGSQNSSANLTGLIPGQTYHYRFVITNGGGKSTTTGDYTFTTLPVAGALPVLAGLL